MYNSICKGRIRLKLSRMNKANRMFRSLNNQFWSVRKHVPEAQQWVYWSQGEFCYFIPYHRVGRHRTSRLRDALSGRAAVFEHVRGRRSQASVKRLRQASICLVSLWYHLFSFRISYFTFTFIRYLHSVLSSSFEIPVVTVGAQSSVTWSVTFPQLNPCSALFTDVVDRRSAVSEWSRYQSGEGHIGHSNIL
jgi:hypothetical protein